MFKRLITWLYERYCQKNQSDDHIALIKESINRTFPVVAGRIVDAVDIGVVGTEVLQCDKCGGTYLRGGS